MVPLMMLTCLLLRYGVTFGNEPGVAPEEMQEYETDLNRVDSVRSSLLQSDIRDLSAYKELADDIDGTWSTRNREYHARLILNICKPLSSGTFEEGRRYELARRYALSALEDADDIPLTLELELIGHVTTVRIGPDASRGEDFARYRKKDVEVRLHAWKRLIDAIDPDWDPDEVLWVANVMPPAATGLSAGVEPEAIKDAGLRSEYEAEIQRNIQIAKEYQEQYEFHKWLERFPRRVESEIVDAYSHPPFDLEELQEMLDDHLIDQDARSRMLEAVDKNMRESQKEGK